MFVQDVLTRIADVFLSIYYGNKKPFTLEHALKQCVRPSLVSSLSAQTMSVDLVQQVASALQVEPLSLLARVAECLELVSAFEVRVPSRRLVESAGYDPNLLQSFHVIPQESETAQKGYFLVCADPTKLNMTEFRRSGITVILGLGKTIGDTWKQYNFLQTNGVDDLSEQQVFSVVRQLAIDGATRGASEIIIGSPHAESYEFFAEQVCYCGKLHPKILPYLLRLLQETTRISLPLKSHSSRSSVLHLARSANRPVVSITFDSPPYEASPPGIAGPASPELKAKRNTGVAKLASEETTEVRKSNGKSPSDNKNDINPASDHHLGERTFAESILLIDDDPRFLFILRKMLEGKGWQVVTQTHAKAALELIQRAELIPRLIVSDVYMPGMDGVTFLRILRETVSDIPVLMLTSDDDASLEAEIALLNADALIRKQEHPQVLLAWCINLIKKGAREKICSSI